MINLNFITRALTTILLTVALSWLSLSFVNWLSNRAQANNTQTNQRKSLVRRTSLGTVYPQFRSNSGIIHWLPEQMPLKVYVAQGQTVEKILDPGSGVSAFNIDNLDHWRI